MAEENINAAVYYGVKSIILAAKFENSEILKMLLKNGEKIHRESFWERTAYSSLLNAVRAENVEIVKLLLEYGAVTDKNKNVLKFLLSVHVIKVKNKELKTLLEENGFVTLKDLATALNSTKKTEFVYEDGFYIPKKHSRNNIFIQHAKEGKINKMKELLNEGVSEEALLSALDAALEKNNWEIALFLSEYSHDREVETYTECIKKMFLKASYIGDTEKVKFYLEKLIENVVGILTDETGKNTMEIALENNPADVIKILSNYGFHENSLRYAYTCLSNFKK